MYTVNLLYLCLCLKVLSGRFISVVNHFFQVYFITLKRACHRAWESVDLLYSVNTAAVVPNDFQNSNTPQINCFVCLIML